MNNTNTHYKEYKNTEEIESRWDKRAKNWDDSLSDSSNNILSDESYNLFLKIAEELIVKYRMINNSLSALDLGCGTGIVSENIFQYVNELTCLDISSMMILEAKKKLPNATYILGDIKTININKKFDVIFSRGILLSHYGPIEGIDIIKKISQLLKPKGLLLIDGLNSKFPNLPENKTWYGIEDFLSLFNNSSLKLNKIHSIESHRHHIVSFINGDCI